MADIGSGLIVMALGVVLIAVTTGCIMWAWREMRAWRSGDLYDQFELWFSTVASIAMVLTTVGLMLFALGSLDAESGVVVEKQELWLPNPALKNIPTIHYRLVLREDDGDYSTVDVSEDAYNHLSPGDWYEGK